MQLPRLNEYTRHSFYEILVGASFWFLSPPPLQNSNWNSLGGGIKYTGWEKFAIFAIYLGNDKK